MSDKSFGDHSNRNIVKNPLLSTAVTGLSLDELTHKAVLLPVSPTLGLTARPEQKGTQNQPLGYTNIELTKSSGDSFIQSPKPILEPNQDILNNQNNIIKDESHKIATVTQSKASLKSEDDFDVNEYIARLQGTRYVSAPIHSHIKEDQHANLDAAEENLEEINLNDNPQNEQQSLTADLKQNFSQLPTVLPHVANAVFSSFSNMLNLRSRDQTPDVDNQRDNQAIKQDQGPGVHHGFGQTHQGTVQYQSQIPVGPLKVEDPPVKEFAPPPREPPVMSGPSNFRLPTKKKYAQIPGLSTGGAQAMPQNLPPQNIPSFFTPPSYTVNQGEKERENLDGSHSGIEHSQNIPSFYSPPTYGVTQGVIEKENFTAQFGNQPSQGMPSVFIPPTYGPTEIDNSSISHQPSYFTPQTEPFRETEKDKITKAGEIVPSLSSYEVTVGVTKQENITGAVSFFTPTNVGVTGQEDNSQDGQSASKAGQNIPTFFNPHGVDMGVTHKEENTKIEANANKESKQNESNILTTKDNITVQQFGIENPQATTPIIPPPPMFSNLRRDSATGSTVGKTILPPSVARRVAANQPIMKSQNVPMTAMDNIFTPELSKDLSETQSHFIPSSSDFAQLTSQGQSTMAFPPGLSLFPSNSTVQEVGLLTQPIQTQHSNDKTRHNSSSTSGTQIILPTDIAETSQPIGVPLFFMPQEKTESSNITSTPEVASITPSPSSQFSLVNPISQEPIQPPKPPIEPPKTGGTNFRMTKKRPQYYSGPIEGFGSISNNIKPTIPIDTPASYQPSLFTPEAKPEETINQEQSAVLEAYSVPQEPAFNPLGTQTGFNINQPQYTQDFNTAFDLSRATTDAYEDTKPEPKGFGIIGSLKSKLSSIDINKIQSSVTTFFDPAYNDAKKIEASSGENAPHGQGQSSFDLYVSGAQNQDPYYQTGYDYTQPNYQQANYTDPNYQYVPVPNNTYTDYTSNIPDTFNTNQNINMFFNPTLTPEVPSIHSQEKYEKEENNKNIVQTMIQQENTHIKDTKVTKIENVELPKPDVITTFDQQVNDGINDKINTKDSYITNPVTFFNTLHKETTETITSNEFSYGQTTYNMPLSSSFFDYPQTNEDFHTRDVNPDIVEDTLQRPANIQTTNAYSGTVALFDNNLKTEEIAEIIPPKCFEDKDSNKPIEGNSLYNIPPTINFFDNQNKNEELKATNVAEKLSNLTIDETKHDVDIKRSMFVSNSQLNTNVALVKETSILQSISRDNIPFVGVSTVPLFGLSAMLADKSKELDNIKNSPYETPKDETPTILGTNTSFFENIAETEIQQKDLTGLSITDVKNVLLIEPPQEDICDVLKRNASSNKLLNIEDTIDEKLTYDKETAFFDHSASKIEKEQIDPSELSICGTCREVNTPVDKEVDLTSQLIENITSRITLANAVEVPLTEKRVSDGAEEITAIDDQLTEITNITDDTFETLQVQSATELLVDASNVSFGWTAESAYPSNNFKFNAGAQNYGFKLDNTEESHQNIDFKMFYNDTSLFFHNMPKNASDEVKAEIKTTKEDVILPRQMSIPSAPPAEEDSKFETGLDVHSIEQDAKKDFPIEEEFVIEPSETDDDKIEQETNKAPELGDTFTNRVERFQKATDVKDISENAPKSMASYFDTGNYAVESHYKNSLTSPNIRMPGFEDRRSSGFSGGKFEPYIPDTSTQTKTINTCTVAQADNGNHGYMSFAGQKDNLPPFTEIPGAPTFGNLNYDIKKDIVPPFVETVKVGNDNMSFDDKKDILPPYGGILGAASFGNIGFDIKNDLIPPFIEKSNVEKKTTDLSDKKYNTPPLTQTFSTVIPGNINISAEMDILPRFSQESGTGKPENINFDNKKENLPFTEMSGRTVQQEPIPISQDTPKAIDKKESEDVPKTENIHLTDPMNFFSSTIDESKPETADYNRLASYFSTPVTKPDHSKSFFELSQSQNHYRHPNPSNTTTSTTSLNLNLDQTSRANIANLMQDLTAPNNIKPQNIVTTINYFTIDVQNKTKLDNIVLKNNAKEITEENNINNNHLKLIANGETNDIKDDNLDIIKLDIDTNFKTIINCRSCNINTKEFKVRQCTNDTESKRDNNSPEMQTNKTEKPVVSDYERVNMSEEAQEGLTVVEESKSSEYIPVRHHWFYRVDVEEKSVWRGFSVTDSRALEDAFNSPDLNENTLVPTDGGRFDVNVVGRLRIAVYWNEKPTNVRRCSWFYKGTTDARYVPYTETVADKLEDEYRHGVTTGEWHRRLVLPNNEIVIMHGPSVMVHFLQGTTDAFSTPAATSRPRVVRRGHEESEIEEASPTGMDHLLLLCHGVGSACDMRFRSVEEVVEDFRATSLQLVQSHYKNSYDNGVVNRVEVLPISWHAQLHSGEAGVDRRLSRITLDSIPRLRAFTNHTVLDVLFYTSPVYHQTIIDTVCYELNRIYTLFKARNPDFKGGVSLGGHSLGSVILYDLLCHQKPDVPLEPKPCAQKTYLPGIVSNTQIKYPILEFQPDALYALGSPIAIFECIRGVESLGLDFCFPTCKNFFNIFHPYDPIAYRIEPLINPQLQDTKPFLIPHHKGRKRMHLELKDTMVRVGADLKQKLLESLRTTWNKWKSSPPTDGQLEKVVEEEIEKENLCDENKEECQENIDLTRPEILGSLNGGRRIDYVLQEAPLEMINEYLFAMSSHVGYWESEDTMLLMLREIYSSLGVQPDSTVPQQSMTVQRTRRLDEATVVNEKESPSTSRGG